MLAASITTPMLAREDLLWQHCGARRGPPLHRHAFPPLLSHARAVSNASEVSRVYSVGVCLRPDRLSADACAALSASKMFP